MPTEEVVEVTPSPETDLSLYRKEREGEAPATVPAEKVDEPVKTAPVTEAGKAENLEEEEAVTGDKPKGGFQRRIDKLTKEKADLERLHRDEIDTLKTRLEALEKPKAEIKAEAKAEGDPEPKEESFKEYRDFLKEMARWVTRQELKAEQEKTSKASQDEQRRELETRQRQELDKYRDDFAKLRQSDPDLEKALTDDLRVPNYIHAQLVRMKEGAHVAASLIKNKAVWERIAQLNDEALQRGDNDFSEAWFEFGAFVRSLSKNSPKPPERPVSQAPAPITPVGGGASPSEVDPDKTDLATYRRGRESGRIR